MVPVSAGTSVTVWEMSGEYSVWTIGVEQLMTTGFYGWTWGHEDYVITSDGVSLNIWCDRWWTSIPYPCEAVSTGNNIVAAQLNGVPDYPDGLWASVVVDYSLGLYGSSASIANALGPVDQLGPYRNSPCSYIGDGVSTLTLGFASPGWSFEAPVAVAGDDIRVAVGVPVTLDGSASYAPAGMLGMFWQFNYLGTNVYFDGESATFSLGVEGQYEVTLMAIDIWGQVATDTIVVDVGPETTYVGTIVRGTLPRLVWTYAPETDGMFGVMMDNNGLTSVYVFIRDMTPGVKAKPVTIRVDFAAEGAFPTGTVTTDSMLFLAGHNYQIALRLPHGDIGSYADVYQVWTPM
jgi:hypothetical protein